jgi:glycosyltransferase 2 family protein
MSAGPDAGSPVSAAGPRRPSRRTTALRATFLTIAVAASLWTLRHDLGAVPSALARIGPARAAAAMALVLVGVLCTAESWRSCLAAFGTRAERSPARRVFFPTQLGKYVPGSVWPFVMQARLAGELGASAAVLLGTGAVFLAVHLATGAVIAAATLPWSSGLIDGQLRWSVALAVVTVVLLHPRILALLVRLLRRDGSAAVTLGWRDVLAPAGWLVPTWTCYGVAAVVLVAAVDNGPTTAGLVAMCIGAFALAWVAGLLVLIAPAGLGAREVVLALALAPIVGPAAAASVALVLRVCHVMADVILALWFAARRRLDT